MANKLHQNLRQRLAGASAGRRNRKRGRISPEVVTHDTEFLHEERTYLDPAVWDFITEQMGDHFILACGCRVTSPSAIRGVCVECAHRMRQRVTGRPRFVCKRHRVCNVCRRRRMRRYRLKQLGKGVFKAALWPVADVDYEED